MSGFPRGSSGASGALTLIQKIALVAQQASIDFQNIPSSYSHLLAIFDVRSARAATSDELLLQFNGDGNAAHYNSQQIEGSGAAASAQAFAGTQAGAAVFFACAASDTAGISSPIRVLIPNYTVSIFDKNALYESGNNDAAGFADVYEGYSSTWLSTNVVNRLTLVSANAANFVVGSTGWLYGIS